MDVIDIDEEEFSFDIYFSLLVKWFDKNLQFSFLKRLSAKNSVSPAVFNKIWVPDVEFNKVNLRVNSFSSQIFISRNGMLT